MNNTHGRFIPACDMGSGHIDVTERTLSDARELWNYLRLNQTLARSDIALVLGGHDLSVGIHASELYHRNLVRKIVVSGGELNIPPAVSKARAATEADAIASCLFDLDVPESAVLIERKARNTSENFSLSAELLKGKGVSFETCIVVTKPYAERRALATGGRQWPGVRLTVSGLEICFEDYLRSGIPAHKIFSMMTGEIQRLERYHSLGYILYQDIPVRIMEAAKRLEGDGYIDRALL